MSMILKPEGIEIDGQPVLVLSSSLFYFRVPRDLWRDRMLKIQQSGYNSIDVYFPWNNHELSEGKWNFHGERDVSEFLHMAADIGLWVIARPGPYICSEWDGGGLPAYLFTKPGLCIRDDDPRYLRYVRHWFDRILSVIEPYQLGRGGTVIALQLENELDFFDCQDRPGYMESLRDMARAMGIKVPLIACAGQGDLRGATGGVHGIIPTCNIYNSDLDAGVEQRTFHLHERLQSAGLPLCVTETNRSHFFLRRLLSAGAKLLGPYLQTGGVNFGFTNAINNWGQPLSFLATDYDFGGMIASDGELREEYREAALFSRLISAFGSSLARAKPVRLPADTIQGGLPEPEGGFSALNLADGGYLLSLPNFTADPQPVRFRLGELTIPCHSPLNVEPLRCPLLPVGIPLRNWDLEGSLAYSTAELFLIKTLEKGAAFVFGTNGASEIALALPADAQVEFENMRLVKAPDRVILTFEAVSLSTAKIQYSNGRELLLYAVDRVSASLAEIGTAGLLEIKAEPNRKPVQNLDARGIAWHAQSLGLFSDELDLKPSPAGSRAPSLEEMGILRGFGWYRTQVSGLDNQLVHGYLLQGAADVLSLYADGVYIATVTPAGGSIYLPVARPETHPQVSLEVRAEIWGHSNFDDSRLPALRLDSQRGLAGLVAVLHEREITSNWHIHLMDEAENKDLYTARGFDTRALPLVSFAGWLSTRSPNRVCYRKHITVGSGPVDRWVLSFPGLTRPVEVSVNGSPFKRVTHYDPYLDISKNIDPAVPVELALYGEQDYHGQLAGRVILLEGKSAEGWAVGGKDEAGLWKALSAAVHPPLPASPEFPFKLASGRLAVLWADLPRPEGDLVFDCPAVNAKLSVFFNGHLVGRIWGGANTSSPRIAGGVPDRVYLPGPWWEKHTGRLLILVEAIDADLPAEVGPFG